MTEITAFKSQKSGNRVNVYIDGQFGFGIDLENFVVLGLRVGQVLSEERINEIVKKAEQQKTYDKLLRFATIRPRSEKEINSWFIRKKVYTSLRPELFDRLKRLELVDDYKFTEWWVNQRLQFKNKSKKDIKNELLVKGIAKDIIDDVLHNNPVDEFDAARKEIEKRAYRWGMFDTKTAQKKKIELLLRKGFGWDIVEKVVKKG